MKRKTNKKSGIIAAVVGLSAVSLVSVGFASWVLSSDETTIGGTIEVDTVTDNRFLIGNKILTYGDAAGNDVKGQGHPATKIVYGIDDTLDVANHWLGVGDDNKYENLDAKLTFFVAKAPTKNNIQVSFAPAAANAEAWNYAANTAKLVAAPTISEPAITDPGNEDDTGITGACKKVVVNIHFQWGDAFHGENPYKYYNDQDYSLQLATEAKNNLTALNTYLSNISYVLTIKTVLN